MLHFPFRNVVNNSRNCSPRDEERNHPTSTRSYALLAKAFLLLIHQHVVVPPVHAAASVCESTSETTGVLIRPERAFGCVMVAVSLSPTALHGGTEGRLDQVTCLCDNALHSPRHDRLGSGEEPGFEAPKRPGFVQNSLTRRDA